MSLVIGNYKEDVVKPVYVVSSAEKVELFLNGKIFRKRSKRLSFLVYFQRCGICSGQVGSCRV
ncbi:DUF4982 domain-containing protein [Phocaeicola dorei]|nr:DUF4982 domain-containing protein [Phocaeicola dorei]